MPTSTSIPAGRAEAHPIELALVLALAALEALAVLLAAAISLVLAIAGWRPEGFPQKSPETSSQGDEPITTPAPVPQEKGIPALEPLAPEADPHQEPEPATPAPRKRAPRARKPITPQLQPGQASPRPTRRRRSPAAV